MTDSKPPTLPRRWRLLPLCLAVATASYGLRVAPAFAGPEGGQITGGAGTISGSGHNTRIEQMSDLLSIQWDSFNIDRHESVDFLQPHSSSVVLNQILQNGPSQIQGRLNANGHVLLINPRGVIFGENANVNVGALTASTLWLDKDDFLNGEWKLRAVDDEGGVVVNSGIINAASGVTLLGEQVRNEGLVSARLGYINLVSGREAFLTFDQEGFLGVKVSQEVLENLLDEKASVENSGQLSAPGGRVLLEANVSRGLFDSAVNNSGIIEAQGFGEQEAGSVRLLGDTVHVASGSVIDASGDGDGGEILVGGDYLGGNSEVQNAFDTRVEAGALLNASAGSAGDGGRVIVWADHATTFAGDIQARGGRISGDGGFAEVSGKQYLQISGHADLSATAGEAGTLLLDPGSVNIVDGDDTDPADPPDRNEINDGWIEAQLGSGNLVVTTADANTGPPDITVDDDVAIDIGGNTLTLTAGEDIYLGAATFENGDLALNIGQTGVGVLDLGTATLTSASVSISGGSAGDTVQGASSYIISGADEGTANGHDFTGIENLAGTTGDDSFAFQAGGSLSGGVDGVSGVADTVSYADTTTLSAGNEGQNIDIVEANGTGDTLTAAAAADFVQSALDETGVNGTGVVYRGFENLLGSGDNDTFDLAAGGLSGTIDGAGGSDTILGLALYAITGTDAGTAGTVAFSNVENLTGSAGNDTFTFNGGTLSGAIDGAAGDDEIAGLSAYAVSGADSGTAGTVTFSNVENLTGTTGDDNFNFAAGGSLSGGVDGVSGAADTVTYAATTTLSAGSEGQNIDIVEANGAGDTLTAAAAADFVQTGLDESEVDGTGVVYRGFENLLGSGGNDTFDLAAGGLSGTIDGAGGSDTILGLALYAITSANAGTAGTVAFSNVENLTGTTGDDNFNFAAGGSLSGGVDGVSGAADTVTYAATTTLSAGSEGQNIDIVEANGAGDTLTAAAAADFVQTGLDETEVDGTGVIYRGFENLLGSSGNDTFDLAAGGLSGTIDGAGGSDTILGLALYAITGADAGTAGTVTFSNVENLTGTAGDDNFNFAAGGSLSGSVSGLAGNDTFTFSGGTLGGSIDGGDDSDTIVGASTYSITGTNAGTADGGNFSNIENLTGSANADTFTFAGGTLSGTINGDAGSDTIAGATLYTISGTDAGTADGSSFSNVESLTGSSGDDTFTFTGGTLTGAIDGASGDDEIAGLAAFDINGANSGTAAGIAFSNVEDLSGTGGDDIFSFLAGGSLTGTVDGVSGAADTVRFTETVTYTEGSTGLNIDIVEANGAGDTLTVLGASDFVQTALDETEINGTPVIYRGFENLLGSSGNDTFDLAAGGLSGTIDGAGGSDTILGLALYAITGADAGTAGTVTFSNVENLSGTAGDDNFNFAAGGSLGGSVSGLAGNDTFTFAGGTLGGSIDGGDDSDTIVGASTYSITGTNAGTADGGNFSNIENLTGSANADTFTFAGGTLSGTINGDAGSDTIAGATLYTISGTDAGTADGSSFSNVESLTGSSGDDTFTFTGGTLTGAIDGASGDDEIAGLAAFDINGANSGTAAGIAFSNVEDLSGTGGDDIFSFLAGGSLTGTVDGVSGAADTVRFTETVTYTEGSTGLNIDIVEANGAGDTLTVLGASDFVQTALDETEINGTPVIYRGFENLLGSSGNDTFDLAAGGLSGTIDGAGGSDTILGLALYAITGADAGTAGTVAFSNVENLTGTAGDDNFNFAAGGSLSGSVSGLAGNDTLAGANTFIVTGSNSGSSSVADFTGVENLRGTAGDDSFTLQGGSISGTLAGLAGDDTFAGASTFVVSGANAGTGNGTGFSDIENLSGSGGSDTFTFLAGATLSGLIDGLLGTDTIAGASFYEIDGANRGTANSLGVGFQNVENLAGTTGNDTFNFLAGGSLSGTVDGVTGFADTISYASTITYTAGMDGLNIDIVQANAANDTLTVAGASSFVQTGIDSTRINGGPVVYSGFENLLGSSGNDSFDLAGFGVSGSIDGGAGADTLRGATLYAISGSNSGTAGSTVFSRIENLSGTAGNDLFSIEGGALDGSIDGLGGSDTLQGASNFNISGNNSGTADNFTFSSIENLRGTTGNDVFTLAGGSVDGLISGLAGTDLITGGRNYRITGANAGTVDGGQFTSIESLTGSAGADSFEFLAGGVISGSIDAAGGSDSLTLAQASGNSVDITAPATLRVNNATVVRNIETVSRTGQLSASGISAAYDLVGSDGVRLTSPAPSILFTGVSLLSGNGNESLSLNGAGVVLQNAGFTIGSGGIAVSNIGTINSTGPVSGSGASEVFSLSGTSLTVDTQLGNTFLGVTQIQGNGGQDTLENQGAGITLGSGEFVTGGGVRVSGVEIVQSTGDLAGSTQQEIFSKEDDLILVSSFSATSFGGVVELDGGEGNDTLVGASNYVLQGQDSGTADGQVFLNVENLHGSDGDDTFTRQGGSLSGIIDGLGGDGDHLIGFSRFSVTGEGAGSADGIQFTGIESLTGSGGANDVLAGVSNVSLTELDGGTADSFRFRQIANLVGTAGADRFVANGGSLSGSIDGAGQGAAGPANSDASAAAAGDRLENFSLFELADGGQSGSGSADGVAFSNIEVLVGTASAEDRLVGGSDYVIKGENSGTVAAMIRFIDIESLVGTAGDDRFIREEGGRLDGSIDGLGQGANGDLLANFSQFILDEASAGGVRGGTADGARFANIEVLEGTGAAGDVLSGASRYRIDGADAGTADDSIRFSRIANLVGTGGDDRFARGEGGSLSGSIDGLGQGSGGDTLENFSAYQLDPASGEGGRSGTADATAFRDIENLVGTAGGDDSLSGASDYHLDGVNRGSADGLTFSGIENLTGTDGDDSFDLSNGRVDGLIRGSVSAAAGDSDTLLGLNYFALEGDDSGVAQQRDAAGQVLSSSAFESIENLVGTDGNDTFLLGSHRLSGSVAGLAGLDVLSIDQTGGSGASPGLRFTLDGNTSAQVQYGADPVGFRYSDIEDVLLALSGDLTLDGAGTLSSSRDITIGGDFTLNGPDSDPPLVLRAQGNLTVDGSLALNRRSVVDVSSDGSLLTIGGGLSVDTAGGSQINAVIVISVTGEPVIQLEVEETTSLSIFDDIAVFNAGRRSVSRRSIEGVSDEIENEGQLIKALQAAAGP
ncbi:filamentous hemagglutinin N-terminal domain-containing protein [Parahaliea aestuarii]|nr:filamentous hemagglutinin N-terminal domain-containing protein [Parahaliea aestuarii]